MPRQVWRLVRESSGVTGQHSGRGPQVKLIVGPGERLQKPAAEETRTTRDENPLPAKFFPQSLGVLQDVVEVLRQRVHRTTCLAAVETPWNAASMYPSISSEIPG